MKNGEDYIVNGKYINLLEEDWDYLIILDACRYDFFKQMYKKYLKKGYLKKAVSPATFTPDWLNKIFGKLYYKNIIYISANPFINSKYIGEFSMRKYFFKIIDVWKSGWKEKFGSVPPNELNKAFFKLKDVYKDKRVILHYIQPHQPYIGKKYRRYISKKQEKSKLTNRQNQAIQKIKNQIIDIFIKIFGVTFIWKISFLIPFLPKNQLSSIYAEEGWMGLKKAYQENLELVLKSVKELLDKIPSGKIIITADHGEFLGEYGLYEHPDKIRRPENTEVPWLEINKGKRKIKKDEKIKDAQQKTEETSKADEKLIKERLKALGYLN